MITTILLYVVSVCQSNVYCVSVYVVVSDYRLKKVPLYVVRSLYVLFCQVNETFCNLSFKKHKQ